MAEKIEGFRENQSFVRVVKVVVLFISIESEKRLGGTEIEKSQTYPSAQDNESQYGSVRMQRE